MPTDLEIAQSAVMKPIGSIASHAGIPEKSLIPYGHYMAKVDPSLCGAGPSKAKLILVTAITPTPAGEGKTTVSVALADGMRKT